MLVIACSANAWGQTFLSQGRPQTPGDVAQYNNAVSAQASVQGGGVLNSSLTLPNPAALAGARLRRTIASVYVTSMSGSVPPAMRYGGCGLIFTPGTSKPIGNYGEIFNAASGIYWEPQYSNSPVKACEFGAIGNGNYNFSNGAITGTDNTPMIQAAINYALQHRYGSICLSDGAYKTTDTIQLGYDASYTLSLVPCGMGRAAYYDILTPVTILPTKTDRCALNIQAQRSPAVRGIQFIGQNIVYGKTVIDGHQPYPSMETAWLDPALVPAGVRSGGLALHSPYAAICIDAYSGPQPAVPYPAVTYPAWTGISRQYNKGNTSDIELSNVRVLGFAVGISLQSNADANGDFLKIDKFDCQLTVYCTSIPTGESRGVQYTNASCSGVFTLLTTTRFGVQIGKLGGTISNITCGLSYQLFQIGDSLGYNGNVNISQIYAEGVVRLGEFENGGSNTATVTITGCDWSGYSANTRVIPAAWIESNGTPVNFSITGCHIGGNQRIDVLVHGQQNLVIDGGNFVGGSALGTLFNSVAIQRALNFSGGVFLGGPMVYPQPRLLRGGVKWLNPTLASYMTTASVAPPDAQQLMGSQAIPPIDGKRANYNQAMSGLIDSVNGRKWSFAVTATGEALSLSALGSGDVSVVATYTNCDTMTFTLIAARQKDQITNLAPGDILYHAGTGTIFVVTMVGAPDISGNYPITTRQMNNMTVYASGACLKNSNTDTALTGITHVVHTDATVPINVYFGDFTLGSDIVANVTDGVTSGSHLTDFIKPGDRLWPYPRPDAYYQWPYPALSKISTVTAGTPGSIRLSGTATATGRFPILPFPVVGGH